MRHEIRTAIKDIRADGHNSARLLALQALQALKSVAADCDGEELREISGHSPRPAHERRHRKRRRLRLVPLPRHQRLRPRRR